MPKSLVQLIKAKPNTFNYASAGNGTAPTLQASCSHVCRPGDSGHSLQRLCARRRGHHCRQHPADVPQHVYRLPQVKGGKLRALGIAGEKRSIVMPELPTLAEQGIANVNMSQWYAMFAPAKTPKAVIDKLNKEMNAILNRQGDREKN